jgi:hypothetical protein
MNRNKSQSGHLVNDGLHVMSSVAGGDFTNPLLEAVLRLFRPHQLSFVADLVSQKGALF